MLIVNALQTPPLFIANEAFRGLPQWQAVLREGSTVLCATESWVPRRGGGVISVVRRNINSVIDTPRFAWNSLPASPYSLYKQRESWDSPFEMILPQPNEVRWPKGKSTDL